MGSKLRGGGGVRRGGCLHILTWDRAKIENVSYFPGSLIPRTLHVSIDYQAAGGRKHVRKLPIKQL